MLHEGYNYNVLKLKPALTFSLDNARELIKAFTEILDNKLYLTPFYTIGEWWEVLSLEKVKNYDIQI